MYKMKEMCESKIKNFFKSQNFWNFNEKIEVNWKKNLEKCKKTK